MRILFMGTPQFAAEGLKALCADGHNICGVFTKQDTPKGRGMKMAYSAVKTAALELSLDVYQPTSLKDDDVYEAIKSLAPELIVVVAYGKLLPQRVLDIPKYGCINIHGSVLPKYRGSAPIQWAVINGDKYTGVTAMYLSAEMDAGDIIDIKTIPIERDDTSESMFSKLSVLGADLLSETVKNIENGSAMRTAQDHSEATYAPMLTKEMGEIDWNSSGNRIISKINGMIPWPIAYTEICGVKFKIFKAVFEPFIISAKPGTVIEANKTGLCIACSDGIITITELQAPGGKRMAAADYLRGHPLCQ